MKHRVHLSRSLWIFGNFEASHYTFIWLRITDEGSISEMCILSIWLFEFDLKFCIHLSRSPLLYFRTRRGRLFITHLYFFKQKPFTLRCTFWPCDLDLKVWSFFKKITLFIIFRPEEVKCFCHLHEHPFLQ